MEIIHAMPITGMYRLKMDGSSVNLKVIVGYGQISTTSFSIKPTIKSPSTISGSVTTDVSILLGTDQALLGQRLSVLITVAATHSLKTSLNIILNGGASEANITVHADAKQIGDVIAYEAYFRFTKS